MRSCDLPPDAAVYARDLNIYMVDEMLAG